MASYVYNLDKVFVFPISGSDPKSWALEEMRNREKFGQWSTLFSKDIITQLGGIILAVLILLSNPLLLEAGVRWLEVQYLYIHGSLKPSGTTIWNNKTVHCPWILSSRPLGDSKKNEHFTVRLTVSGEGINPVGPDRKQMWKCWSFFGPKRPYNRPKRAKNEKMYEKRQTKWSFWTKNTCF